MKELIEPSSFCDCWDELVLSLALKFEVDLGVWSVVVVVVWFLVLTGVVFDSWTGQHLHRSRYLLWEWRVQQNDFFQFLLYFMKADWDRKANAFQIIYHFKKPQPIYSSWTCLLSLNLFSLSIVTSESKKSKKIIVKPKIDPLQGNLKSAHHYQTQNQPQFQNLKILHLIIREAFVFILNIQNKQNLQVMTKPLALDNKRPLTYVLPNTNLQDHLSYIDQDINEYKGKVAYMIKMQQKQSMTGINPFSYIDQIKVPETPFINSERFSQELQKVKNRVNGQSEAKKDKKKEKLAELDQQKLLKGKISLQNLRITSTQIKDSLILYQQSLLKNINLQQRKQFSPMLLKQLIQSLQQQKTILRQRIERQREQISEINRLRKYEQLEAREKQEVVGQRIRLMVNKRRKLE